MNPFRRRGLLIAISGIDGSGKTTQVELLEERLRNESVDAWKVWCRWRPISSLPLLSILRRLGYARVYATSSIGFVETRIPRTGGLAFLWCVLTQLDNLAKTGFKVILPLMRGRTVICDRYMLDLLVEAMADLHDDTSSRRLGFRLLGLLPRPDEAFLVMVDAEVAFKRKPDMPSISHFIERVRLYTELGKTMRVRVLNGLSPPGTIHGEIWSRISRISRS